MPYEFLRESTFKQAQYGVCSVNESILMTDRNLKVINDGEAYCIVENLLNNNHLSQFIL